MPARKNKFCSKDATKQLAVFPLKLTYPCVAGRVGAALGLNLGLQREHRFVVRFPCVSVFVAEEAAR